MPCTNPISLKRNEDIVPCGKCYNCLKSRSNQWVFRLLQECKTAESLTFTTLTYSNDNIPLVNYQVGDDEKTIIQLGTLYKKHTQDFWKRLRKNSKSKNLKYYICGEYGTNTKRPHYHAIIFNLKVEFQNEKFITDTWKLGNTLSFFNIDEAMIRYTTKYVMKNKDNKNYGKNGDNRQPQFSLMSKGLGKSFLTPEMTKYLKDNQITSIQIQGAHTAIPRYYKDKVYDADDKLLISIKNEVYREQRQLSYKGWRDYVQHQEYLEKKASFFERIKM